MIAIVYPQFYGVGGIARYLDSLLNNLPPNHPGIILITGDECYTERSYPGVELIHIPIISNRIGLVLWGIAVRKLLIKMYKAKLISHVNFHWPPLIPGLFLPSNIPITLTAHSSYLGISGNYYDTKYFESQWSAPSLRIKMWMERQIFRKADRVIKLTEQGRQEVFRYGFKGPIKVIPNGVDVSKFKPDNNSAKDIDILFSGRIEHCKGSVPMVELCKRLIDSKQDIRIYIVGYGNDYKWVKKELAPFSDNIVLTGKVSFDDMVSYYNRSRIYVSTSYYEGLPGTCLEAMSMQLPVVVWDFLFYRDLVVEGETGHLVPPNDFGMMVNKILSLLANSTDSARLGQNGRRLLESDYNWSKLAGDIIKVYES